MGLGTVKGGRRRVGWLKGMGEGGLAVCGSVRRELGKGGREIVSVRKIVRCSISE